MRSSLGSCPAFLIDANVPGAGKGKLARALAALATGRAPTIITEGHSPEELEKRLASAILSGTSCLLLDNVKGHLASSTLESGLTEGLATIRPFGKLGSDITVPCNALAIVTSNNASTSTDLLRRVLPVRIVVETDEPERVRFGFEPADEVARDRLALLADVFTVVRAWEQTDREETRDIRSVALGSFAAWSDMIGGAVAWLTGMHPADIISERKRTDPTRSAKAQLFDALRRTYGFDSFDAKNAAQAIDGDLWRAFKNYIGEHPSPLFVGRRLLEMRDQVVNGLRLVSATSRTNTQTWALEQVRSDVTIEYPVKTFHQMQGMKGIAGDQDLSRAKFSRAVGGTEIGAAGDAVSGSFSPAKVLLPCKPQHPLHPQQNRRGRGDCIHCGQHVRPDSLDPVRLDGGRVEHFECGSKAAAREARPGVEPDEPEEFEP